MKVRELQLEILRVADPTESLLDAAGRMRFFEIGSLAVLERGEHVAIITERDLARAVADGVDPDQTMVASYMTPGPVTISVDADIVEAGVLMMTIGVRHLPVTDGGMLIGMVSARDLLGAELVTRGAPGALTG